MKGISEVEFGEGLSAGDQCVGKSQNVKMLLEACLGIPALEIGIVII